MIKIRILLTRKEGGGIENDDKVLVESYEHGLFQVTYSTPEVRRNKSFVATESRVMDYLEDVVYSVSRDTDPFSHIQLSTCIHPSVMYEIADLYDKDICDILLNMSADALRLHVTSE